MYNNKQTKRQGQAENRGMSRLRYTCDGLTSIAGWT